MKKYNILKTNSKSKNRFLIKVVELLLILITIIITLLIKLFRAISKNFLGNKRNDYTKQEESNHRNRSNHIYERQIQGQIIQVLETIYILNNSSKIDTVKSRLSFLQSILPNIITASKLSAYEGIKRVGIDNYLANYYDRIISEEQQIIIDNPESIYDNWQRYTDYALTNCFFRYANLQKEHIITLKTQKGRDNRKNLIKAAGMEVYNEITSDDIKIALKKFIDDL